MKEVRIKLEKKHLHYSLPTSYEEMTEKQFIGAISLSAGQITHSGFYSLFGIKVRDFFHLPYWAKVEIDKCFEWMSDLSQSCNKILLSKFSCGMSVLHTVGERLAGMSFQQFMTVDSYFSYFGVTRDKQHLYNMVASLYLEKGTGFALDDGHKHLVDVQKSAKRLQKLLPNHAIFNAIYMNWVLIKNWLTAEFKYLFPRGESDGKPQPANWLELFDSFVGDNIPHMESYQRMECMDAFRIINTKIREQQKLQR